MNLEKPFSFWQSGTLRGGDTMLGGCGKPGEIHWAAVCGVGGDQC